LNSLARKKPKYKTRFKMIILAAADIDADIFKNQIVPTFNIVAAQQFAGKVHRK
jgi:esterase/lipase superfamily enzyme